MANRSQIFTAQSFTLEKTMHNDKPKPPLRLQKSTITGKRVEVHPKKQVVLPIKKRPLVHKDRQNQHVVQALTEFANIIYNPASNGRKKIGQVIQSIQEYPHKITSQAQVAALKGVAGADVETNVQNAVIEEIYQSEKKKIDHGIHRIRQRMQEAIDMNVTYLKTLTAQEQSVKVDIEATDKIIQFATKSNTKTALNVLKKCKRTQQTEYKTIKRKQLYVCSVLKKKQRCLDAVKNAANILIEL